MSVNQSQIYELIFSSVKSTQFRFVTDENDQIQDVIVWSGDHWVPGKKQLIRHLIENEVFDTKKDAKENISLVFGVLCPKELSIRERDLDSRDELLTFPGGVANIKTGKARKPHPDDLNTRKTDIVPDKNVPTPNWDKYLSDLCSTSDGQRDEEYERYLTQILGYSLFGLNDKKEFYLLYGPSGNEGKSTLFSILGHLLGPKYFYTGNQDIIVKNEKNGQDRFCLAPLKGRRIVALPELEKNSKLNTVVIKKITGRDPINAQFKSKNEFTFLATCKIFCYTNHLPEPDTKGSISSVKQRTRILPLEHVITEIDSDLDSKLKKEASGILAKLLRAGIDGYKDGVKIPLRVQREEEQQWESRDTLSDFLKRFKKDTASKTKSAAVKEMYEEWLLETMGERSTFNTTRSFNTAVRERDMSLKTKVIGGDCCIIGIDFSSFCEPTHQPPEESKKEEPKPEPQKFNELPEEKKAEVVTQRKAGESLQKAANRLAKEEETPKKKEAWERLYEADKDFVDAELQDGETIKWAVERLKPELRRRAVMRAKNKVKLSKDVNPSETF